MGCLPKGIDRSSPTYRSLPFEMDSIPKRTKSTFARWLMELQGLPLRIETRPDKDNIVADYLSHQTNGEIDEHVNAEESFEEKVFHIRSRKALQRKIERKQREDSVIRDALFQIQS